MTRTNSGDITKTVISSNIADPLEISVPSPDPDFQSTFDDGFGGGLYVSTSDILIRDSEIASNKATSLGGGAYFSGDKESITPDGATGIIPATPNIYNSLITENTAGTGGGGVANTWYVQASFENCTIAENVVTEDEGFGGGIYSTYDSNSVVINSILWDNQAADGSQIALDSGSPALPYPCVLDISYSDIQGYSDPDSGAIYVDTGSTLNVDQGSIIDADPLFVQGYHLSHLADQYSPCIDKGSHDNQRSQL